jgi:protein TonB
VPAVGAPDTVPAATAAVSEGQPHTTPAGERSLVARAADAVRAAVGAVFGRGDASTANAATASAAASAKAADTAPARRSRSAGKAAAAAAAPLPPVEQPRAPTLAPSKELEASFAAAAGARPRPSIVYTSSDPGVTPPVLVRPMLPAEPPPSVPPEQVGTLVLVVDEDGNVEQVRLSSPANRYAERMLVSHAKTWKFKPATRDGHPVKYRTRVRVTI